jgi:hypothetical protein
MVFVVQCKRCSRNIPAGVEVFPFASIVVNCSLLILAFWFGPATAVKFGPLGQHWLGFMDGATEA